MLFGQLLLSKNYSDVSGLIFTYFKQKSVLANFDFISDVHATHTARTTFISDAHAIHTVRTNFHVAVDCVLILSR